MILAEHVLHIEHIPTWTVFLFGVALVAGLALTVRWILAPPHER